VRQDRVSGWPVHRLENQRHIIAIPAQRPFPPGQSASCEKGRAAEASCLPVRPTETGLTETGLLTAVPTTCFAFQQCMGRKSRRKNSLPVEVGFSVVSVVADQATQRSAALLEAFEACLRNLCATVWRFEVFSRTREGILPTNTHREFSGMPVRTFAGSTNLKRPDCGHPRGSVLIPAS
jgi:hypothetical protein